jgi:hypothetical protein
VGFKCAGAGVVVCRCADRIERLQYACVVQGVGVEDALSAFASLMGEFVVCKNSGLLAAPSSVCCFRYDVLLLSVRLRHLVFV